MEDRTHRFGKSVRDVLKLLPRSLSNMEYTKQLIRSSGSVGANYIEANEAMSKADFIKHVRIALKEAKESKHWLDLLDMGGNADFDSKRIELVDEAQQLSRILSAILQKVGAKHIRRQF